MRSPLPALLACLLLALFALPASACGGSGGDDDSNATSYVTATLPDPLPTPFIIGAITPGAASSGGPTTHTVVDGDTPSSIAAQYGITVEALMGANGISDPTSLSVGQQLTIPASGVLGSTSTPPPAIATPTGVPAGPTSNASGDCTYTVATGDVADAIASGAGTTVEELAALNNTTVDDLRSLSVGDVLVVPCAAQ